MQASKRVERLLEGKNVIGITKEEVDLTVVIARLKAGEREINAVNIYLEGNKDIVVLYMDLINQLDKRRYKI